MQNIPKPSTIQSFAYHMRNRYQNFSFNQKLKNLYDFYEDFIGVKEVRKTQEAVLKSESVFAESTKARRDVQNDMIGLQEQLKQIRHKLDSTQRSDESYLSLITKEHQLIKNEIQMIDSLRRLEQTERHLFSEFSNKLRDAHEVERLRQEKTKYLSMFGTIVGACLGIIAASINHAFKRRDFKELAQMIELTKNYKLEVTNTSIPDTVREETPVLVEKTSIQTQTDNRNEDKIVEIITNTESNLEYKMKVNSLTTVVATYALIAITLPIIIRFLGD
ncbi:unnamed protein product [Medioppia subpectinata]|uniref:Coiled-coil domain-containing protein 51 n=1 Tax=Medioppia subpectinata TaxID=1979941 RepID=A0A7R9KQF2_9ACAR|nr:unnamed protein product [Medioppia subpectinata]CAG2106755.1 unnamed protein product [Medioppia subpectinata]